MDYSHCSFWLETLELGEEAIKKKSQIKIHRGSGSGGQKVNKTSNAVSWRFEDFLAKSHKTRSQETNINDCFKKIQLQIALNIKPEMELRPQRENIPDLIKKYYISGQYCINPQNKEYAFFCGYFVDVIIHFFPDYTQILNLSSNQMLRFLKQHKLLYEKFLFIQSTYKKNVQTNII